MRMNAAWLGVLIFCGPLFAQVPAPSGMPDGFLAEGPFPVVLKLAGALPGYPETTEKGILLLLTKDKLVYRNETGKDIKTQTARGSLLKIEKQGDKKTAWVYDAAKKAFTGPVLASEVIALISRKFTAADENRYLFFALERLQARLERDLSAGNETMLRQSVADARAAADHMRNKGLDSGLRQLFEALSREIEARQAIAKDRREIYDQAMEESKKLNAIKTAIQMQQIGRSMPGILQLFGEGLSDRPDRGAVMQGFGGLMDSALLAAREESKLKLAADLFKNEVRLRYEAAQKREDDRRAQLDKQVRATGERLGVPQAGSREEWAEFFRKKQDPQSMLRFLEDKAKQLEAGSGLGNPWLQAEILQTRARQPMADPAKKADAVFELAKKAVALADAVPPGKLFDRDRAALLWIAGGLAVRAAELERGDRSLAGGYSLPAAFALRVFALADALNVIDIDGDVREQQALAMALLGRTEEAMQKLLDIQDLRKNSPNFHFTLARLYGVRKGGADKALTHIEEAIKTGLSDVKSLSRSADLASLKKNQRFLEATKVAAEAVSVRPPFVFGTGKKEAGVMVQVVNRAPFPLVNARLTLTVNVQGKQQTYVEDVPYLASKATYYWAEAFIPPANFGFGFNMQPVAFLTIRSEQGDVLNVPVVVR
jgi:hypothetical protein